MIEIVPFGEDSTKPSRTLYEIYRTVQRTRTSKHYNFLGYIVREGSHWVGIQRNGSAQRFDLRRDAVDHVTGDSKKVTRAA